MTALHRKLLRDLVTMRAQALAIALVVAAGVAAFVSMMSALDSLTLSRAVFYENSRFADVFAQARRAPAAVAARVAEIPGVERVTTRVVADVTLDLPGVDEPVAGRLVSIEPGEEAPLNALHLRSGRLPEPGRDAEALVSEAFATARRLGPGDRLSALLDGRRHELVITGVVLSPEYVYQIGGAQILPDDARFGVLWMARAPLAAALDMDGVANDFAIALSEGASSAEVIDRVDHLLAPYGGAGAFDRSLHPSDKMLSDELQQLRTTGAIIPGIFLAVAAFLLHVVMSRTVATERTQIATLKAFGYGSGAIARHYLAFALVLAGAGAALGVAVGAWLGHELLGLYTRYYRFPVLPLAITARTVGIGAGVTVAAAALGALSAVRRAAREAPAEAMLPEPPPRFEQTWIERIGVGRLLSPVGRMVLRNLARRPGRAALSITGMAMAAAILVAGMFSVDAIRFALDVQFSQVQREDATVLFTRAIHESAANDVGHLPGVLRVEPVRMAPVTLRAGHHTWRTALTGLPRDGELRRLVDQDRRAHPLAPGGLVLGRTVAARLAVTAGDRVTVELLEGDRAPRDAVVSMVVDEVLGGSALMELDELRRFLGEDRVVTGALVTLDPAEQAAFHEHVKRVPAVASVTMRRAQVETFERMLAQNIGVMRGIQILFAAIIAFAIVYNNARIALAERSRELATLRVLGLSRGEVARILLHELLVTAALAIPLGLLIGHGMAALIVRAYATELLRLPLIVGPGTYAVAAATVAISAALSAIVVRRRIDRLDLIGVLKTRD